MRKPDGTLTIQSEADMLHNARQSHCITHLQAENDRLLAENTALQAELAILRAFRNAICATLPEYRDIEK